MKLSHTLVYSLLSFFTVTAVFSQNNGKNDNSNNSTKKTRVGAITGGSDNICVGSKTQFIDSNHSQHSDHYERWSVSNTYIATVSNSGLVTALRPGIFILKYDSNDSRCEGDSYRTIIVNSAPVVKVTGSAAICINGTTTLSPATGGTWASSNTNVATVNNTGVVKGISAGSATFTFTKTGGCTSAATSAVTVNGNTPVSITGSNGICINGTTTLSPTTGGTWSSSNSAVATVNNSGIVKGISAGSATFSFTKTGGCNASVTPAVTVNSSTIVSITGTNAICINGTTTLSPTTGGTWASSNSAVATVNNSGVVKGISAGSATFTFTKVGGCASSPTSAVTINAIPVVSITGKNSICINTTTTLSPTTGGTWSSSNEAVATVNNAGVVKGISAGTATFSFTKTGGCTSLATSSVTINAIPTADITGSNSICINGITTLSPTTGGTWSSSNSAIATVNSGGVVKGISAGTATFRFTKTGGCTSLATSAVTVNANTAVSITGASTICINGTTTLSPTTGGIWSSNNKSVATVNNEGIVTAISSGRVSFTFVKTGGCNSSATSVVTVNSCPVASITGPSAICINGTTKLSPTIGGRWSSSNPAIATVNSAGIVKGISSGTATFTFTRLGSCSSLETPAVTVNARPLVSLTGLNSICINGTTTLSPTTGGTWYSNNKTVAKVTNDGIVTGISSGRASFTFIETGGCTSLATPIVTVSFCPLGSITGPSAICINGTTTLSPTVGGKWISSNPAVATVTNSGLVKGISAGTVNFTFTKTNSCSSLATPPVTVSDIPTVSITGSNTVCINSTTTLSPATGGTWSSSNPAVATVNNSGIVTGISSGTATFTFTKTGGCTSLPTSAVTINGNTAVSITGTSSICINSTTTLSPAAGGTWSSNNTAVATVNNEGIVTGISPGTSTFTFTKTGGCTSLETSAITVNLNTPVSISGTNSICINGTTTLSPTTGGTWSSSNTAVATINNEGLVTGISSGTATFRFTNTGGCTSLATPAVTVNTNTAVSITGTNSICINSTTTLSPASGGTWSSSNTAVATVNNAGIVTGVSSGTATFTFTKTDGCTSLATPAVTVNANPSVRAITGGTNNIAVGSTTQFANSTTGGIWSITNETGSATVNTTGLVTGKTVGTVKINYAVESDGCNGHAASQEITINTATVLKNIAGPDTVSTSELSIPFQNETPGGVWSVKNGSGTATITSQGVVQGINEGTVEIVYTFIDVYGVTNSVSKVITIIGSTSCTGDNPNSLQVQKLFQNLVAHLYNRACNGDTSAQINGSNPAELMALKPYIKNSTADKIYNFSYLKDSEKGSYRISFSFSEGSNSDVVYANYTAPNCPASATIVNGLAGLLQPYASYNTLLQYNNNNEAQQIIFEVKNIDFCPTALYTPLAGSIIASVEKPTTLDDISFSFEPLGPTFSAKKTSSLFSASSAKSTSSSTGNLIYKWLFHALDNVTLVETITDPIALQRFSIPGNYRVILIVTDQNGFETTFYRDVIVTQTCTPIVGKINILN